MEINLDKPLYNIAGITILTIIAYCVNANADYMDNAGMAAIVMVWLPVVIGAFFIGAYLLSRLFTKEKNWYITIVGELVLIGFIIRMLVG